LSAALPAGINSLIGQVLDEKTDLEKMINNILPSYREVLTHSQLPMYVGGELIPIPSENKGKEEGRRDVMSCIQRIGDA
jgi:hypothetical protein